MITIFAEKCFFRPCIQAYSCLSHVFDKQYVEKLLEPSLTPTRQKEGRNDSGAGCLVHAEMSLLPEIRQ